MIENVEKLDAELQQPALISQSNLLENGKIHIFVVRADQKVSARVTKTSGSCDKRARIDPVRNGVYLCRSVAARIRSDKPPHIGISHQVWAIYIAQSDGTGPTLVDTTDDRERLAGL